MIAVESEGMESMIDGTERSPGSPDGVLQTWTPELQQSFVAAGGLWSPYRQPRLPIRNEHGNSDILRPQTTRGRGCCDYRGARDPEHSNMDAFEFMAAPTTEQNYVAVASMGCSFDAAAATERSFTVIGGNGRVITRSINTRPPVEVLQRAPTAPADIEMGRRRRQTGTWTDNQLAATVAAVDAGCGLATAARNMEIPATSLRDHIYGRTIKRKKGRQGVLSVEEESALVKWMLEMQEHAHPICIMELRRKVAEMTQDRWTPFKDGIPGRGWLRWFRNRHPELTLRSAQALEEARAKGLNPNSVASFYDNLQAAYQHHAYPPSHIWNADESGAQTGRSGGGTLVFAR